MFNFRIGPINGPRIEAAWGLGADPIQMILTTGSAAPPAPPAYIVSVTMSPDNGINYITTFTL
jgi:hypothetical protein